MIGRFLIRGKLSARVPLKLPAINRLICKNYSKTNLETESEPINYTKSTASKWQAKYSRQGREFDRLWYEPAVIFISIGIFMLYFCVLREENQIDQELNNTLYSRISGLEEYQLKLSLEYNKKHGKETKDIELRLKEIEAEKSNVQ